jgi:hypothetical protein
LFFFICKSQNCIQKATAQDVEQIGKITSQQTYRDEKQPES